MWKFVGFFALFICAAQANDACESFLEGCVAHLEPYNQIFEDFGSGAAQVSDETLDQFCVDVISSTTCINIGSIYCGATVRDELEGLVTAITYLCSSEGRATLRSMATSPCATDEALVQSVHNSVQDCYNDFETEINMFMVRAMSGSFNGDPETEVCGILEQFRVCTVTGTQHFCGSGFADFINAIWDMQMAEQAGELDCGQRGKRAHSIVRRAITYLKKRR